MTAAPATNELRELADNVRIVALDAADYIGHANYGHRIVEAKQSIREACDELDKALRAAVTPSAQGAQPALAQLDSADARSGNLRRVVLDLLNGVTPAVENLACHQEQADADGCMVKVSRQALDEVLSAVNEVAIQAATNPSTGLLPDASPGKPAAIVTFCITGAIPGDGGACGDCDPCLMGEASMPEPVKRLIAEKNSLLQRIGELEDAVAASPDNGAEKVREHPIETAQRGFDAWAAKEHNKKWFKRIDGTPIPNDLVVCIAMEFAALHSTSAAGETTSSDGGVEGHAATPIWVSADRKVDATSCSIQEGSQSGLAGIKPGPSEAIPADVLAMKEACKRAVSECLNQYGRMTFVTEKGWSGLEGQIRAAIDKLSPEVKAADTFQSRVQPWMMACFGPEISADRIERNHRFLEEALELVQSTGCTQSEAHQLVDYVYGRPVGETHQEIGGVMVTLAALCLALGDDMHKAGETELARIWTMVEKIRAKQAAKPKHSPLPEGKAEGGRDEPVAWMRHKVDGDGPTHCNEDDDGAFPVYVASPHDVEAIRADERERCARIAEATKVTSSGHPQIDAPTPGDTQRAIASAIRTGGQK